MKLAEAFTDRGQSAGGGGVELEAISNSMYIGLFIACREVEALA